MNNTGTGSTWDCNLFFRYLGTCSWVKDSLYQFLRLLGHQPAILHHMSIHYSLVLRRFLKTKILSSFESMFLSKQNFYVKISLTYWNQMDGQPKEGGPENMYGGACNAVMHISHPPLLNQSPSPLINTFSYKICQCNWLVRVSDIHVARQKSSR